MLEESGKLVFATVGTTKFDFLISTLSRVDVLKSLSEKNYKRIIIQKGSGKEIPDVENAKKAGVELSYYDYKNSIHEDIQKADLVISHAGAGTCLEVLEAKKPLLVIINEELMHNHQTELAEKLSCEKFLFASTCSNLIDTIKSMDLSQLKEFQPTKSNLFANFLNDFMGFQEKGSR